MKHSIRFRGFDLIVVVFVALLFGTASLLWARNERETANRVTCARNLRMIGQAILLYANENRGAYPQAIHDPAKPVPTWGTPYQADPELGSYEKPDAFCKDDAPEVKYRPDPNDVTAALFLLIRTQDIPSEAFVCPSARIKPWDFGGGPADGTHWTNWRGNKGLAAHLSYSYQNPYPDEAATAAGFKLNNSVNAEFATAADMNPGGDALLKVTLTSKAEDMRAANSLNHDGDGQNVLFGDGHVEFQQNPFVGDHRDNIYTRGGHEIDTRGGDPGIVGSPVDAADSILLPTAADIGFKRASRSEMTPLADGVDLRSKIIGWYTMRAKDDRDVTLAIDDSTVKSVNGPITIQYDYKIIGTRKDTLVLELSAPNTDSATMDIAVGDGSIVIDSDDFTGALSGTWTAKRS